MNKFLKLVFVSLLFVGSICGVVFGIKYIQQQKQIDNLYTEEEVEQKYQQYIDQISEKNVVIDELNGQLTILVTENEQHETTISNLQSSISEKDSQIETLTLEKTTLTGQIETLISRITELTSQIEKLSEDKENNLAQIEELQSEKSALETQVSTLTASVNEKDQTIQTLTADKTELEEEISILTATISENETTISGLNSQILTLQNEITRLEGLLEGYEDIKNGTFEVNFYIGDTLYATKVVKNGNCVEDLDNPPETNSYQFNFWSLDGKIETDPFLYVITENTTFYAVLIPKYIVEFVMYDSGDDLTSLSIEYVLEGSSLSSEIPVPVKDNFVFMGYSLDGSTVIEIQTENIVSNTTYIAVFKELKELNDCSWEEIAEISSSGKASDFFNVGDTKTFNTTNNISLEVAIMGFNHDDLTEGGKAGITFGLTGFWDLNQYCWDSSISSVNWSTCTFRKSITRDYLNKLPSDLKSCIKFVNKNTSSIGFTSDKLWLFSVTEIFGDGVEGMQYDYWKLNVDNMDIMQKFMNGSPKSWFLRSMYNSSQCRAISSTGNLSSSSLTGNCGVILGFCI